MAMRSNGRARSAPRPLRNATGRDSPRSGHYADSPRAGGENLFVGTQNMNAQMDELQALVKSSREEQALISSKILALKGGVSAQSPVLRQVGGYGTPGIGGDEVLSLREQLAHSDSLLLEREAEIERLRSELKVLQAHVDEPKTGAAWRQRYEESQIKFESNQRDVQHMRMATDSHKTEIRNLSSYLRILEADKETNNKQRERLVAQHKDTEKHKHNLEVERNSLAQQLSALNQGFIRCVGRVTQSLASGVTSVSLDNKNAEARFLLLRFTSDRDRTGVLEIFREPDAHDELMAMELKLPVASAVADEKAMNILLTGSSDKQTLRICCVGMEEYLKWSGALKLVGFDISFPKTGPLAIKS